MARNDDPQDEKALASALGEAIAHMRHLREMTQAQVAACIGVGDEFVSRMERGVVLPPTYRLVQLARLFDMRVGDFFDYAVPALPEQALFYSAAVEPLTASERKIMQAMVLDRAALLVASREAADD